MSFWCHHFLSKGERNNSSLLLSETPEVGGAAGAYAHQKFGISVKPIRTKGGRSCPPYYYCPPPHLLGRCGASDYGTSSQLVFVRFLGENEDTKKIYRNYLTSNLTKSNESLYKISICFQLYNQSDIYRTRV